MSGGQHGPVAMIAGGQRVPVLAAQKAKALNRPLYIAALEGEADPELSVYADRIQTVKLGQIKALIDFFVSCGAQEVFMVGGISREGLVLNYEPDDLALEIMEALTDFHTDKILRGFTDKLGQYGLKVVSVTDIIPEILTPPGLLTKTPIPPGLLDDLRLAWKMATELGRLDVGQCVVVSDKITLAIEGADGTDATIARGASLAKKKVAVAKIAKPIQDLRLDLPTIGPETIKVIAKAGNVGALVIDAGRTLVVDLDETVGLADEIGLALAAWTGREPDIFG